MSNADSRVDMLRAPVVSAFFRYGIPWALAMLLVSSAGIVDGFFIGRHEGSLALAALNIVVPLFSIFMGFSIVLASGGGVRCAHYLGKNMRAEAQAIFTKVMLTLVAGSILLAVLCFVFMDHALRFLGADATILPLAKTYLYIIVPFLPVYMGGVGLAYFVRVDERPSLASTSFASCAVINIILDYVFIDRFGWGIKGAALATGIGCTVMLLLLIGAHFIWNPRPHLRFTRAIGAWKEVWQASWNGMSEMINEVSSGTVMICINIIIMQLAGAYGVAAFTVINYVNWLCLMLAYGFSDSLAPLISANSAAKQPQRVRAFLITALVTVASIGGCCFIVVSLFPEALISIFLPVAGSSTQMAEEFMYIVRFMYIFCGLNIVLTAYFTGRLQATASAIVSLLRSLVLPLPLLVLLSTCYGVNGVAMALPLAEAFTLMIAVGLFIKTRRCSI